MGGRVLLLTSTGGYIQALDTGDLCVGQPRDEGESASCLVSSVIHDNDCVAGEGPQAGEVFSIVRMGETKVALKSAYGRYVSVSISGELAGRVEAIGPREQWEPVFEKVCTLLHLSLLCPLSGVGQGCPVCLQPSFPNSNSRWASCGCQ